MSVVRAGSISYRRRWLSRVLRVSRDYQMGNVERYTVVRTKVTEAQVSTAFKSQDSVTGVLDSRPVSCD